MFQKIGTSEISFQELKTKKSSSTSLIIWEFNCSVALKDLKDQSQD